MQHTAILTEFMRSAAATVRANGGQLGARYIMPYKRFGQD